MPTPAETAEAVSVVTKHFTEAVDGLPDDSVVHGTAREMRLLLAALASARTATALVERVAQCKGFEAAFHFAAFPPEWVVTDTNLDDGEYRGATLAEALAKLAAKYDAARAGEAR